MAPLPADSDDRPERIVISPTRRQRIGTVIAAVFMGLATVFLPVILVVTTGVRVGVPIAAIGSVLPVTTKVLITRETRRPVICSSDGIAGLRITARAVPEQWSDQRMWRSKFVYHPTPVPWDRIRGYRTLRIARYSQGPRAWSYPAVVVLADGRVGRTGFADTSVSRSRRTIAAIATQNERWDPSTASPDTVD